MKFTEDNVYRVEHQQISDLVPWDFRDNNRSARDAFMYILGVHEMADAIIEAMREVKNV